MNVRNGHLKNLTQTSEAGVETSYGDKHPSNKSIIIIQQAAPKDLATLTQALDDSSTV